MNVAAAIDREVLLDLAAHHFRHGWFPTPGAPGRKLALRECAEWARLARRGVRRFYLDCLGTISARGAFDCQSAICPLCQASPFRRAGRRRATVSARYALRSKSWRGQRVEFMSPPQSREAVPCRVR